MSKSSKRDAGEKGKAILIDICVIDKSPIMRLGIRELFANSEDIRLVAAKSSLSEALEWLEHHHCEIVLVNVSLLEPQRWQGVKHLRALHPELRILLIEDLDNSSLVAEAMKAGANGYISQSGGLDQYMNAIRKLSAGSNYISDDLVSELLSKVGVKGDRVDQSYDSLTSREKEIFTLIVAGVRPTDISHQLGISIKTVSAHRKNILDKLGFQSNSQLIRYAIKCELMI